MLFYAYYDKSLQSFYFYAGSCIWEQMIIMGFGIDKKEDLSIIEIGRVFKA